MLAPETPVTTVHWENIFRVPDVMSGRHLYLLEARQGWWLPLSQWGWGVVGMSLRGRDPVTGIRVAEPRVKEP